LGVAQELDFNIGHIPQVATPFGSGISRRQYICEALSAGVIVIGIGLGRATPQGDKDRAYSVVNALFDDFCLQFGDVDCKRLIEVDLGSDEGRGQYEQRNLHQERCVGYVAFVADWLLTRKRDLCRNGE